MARASLTWSTARLDPAPHPLATAERPRVAVIVINWNGLDDTRACVRALLAQEFRRHEIWLVDNGSADGEADVLAREFAGVLRLLRSATNLGFTGGNNLALDEILGERGLEFVALLNNDAFADPDWLGALITAADADPEVAMFASHMVFASDASRTENTGIEITTSGDALPRDRHRPRARSTTGAELLAVCAGAALYRCEVLRELGVFRDDFFANFEDVDLGLRLAATGRFGRFVPSAVVRHRLNASIRRVRSAEFTARSIRNQTLAYLVNMPASVLALNLPWVVLSWTVAPLAALIVGRVALARALVRGRCRAVGDIADIRVRRRRLRPLRSGNPLRIWWLQRAWWIALPLAAWRSVTRHREARATHGTRDEG